MATGDVPALDSARHPFEQFVLFLGLVAAMPLLFGAPAPGSTAELLTPLFVRLWAWLLAGGCLLALVGAWWTWWRWLTRWCPRWQPRATTALMIEQVGLIAMGGGAVVYAFGVATAFGDSGRYIAVALVAGLGMAALWRANQIRRWVKATLNLQDTDGAH